MAQATIRVKLDKEFTVNLDGTEVNGEDQLWNYLADSILFNDKLSLACLDSAEIIYAEFDVEVEPDDEEEEDAHQ